MVCTTSLSMVRSVECAIIQLEKFTVAVDFHSILRFQFISEYFFDHPLPQMKTELERRIPDAIHVVRE